MQAPLGSRSASAAEHGKAAARPARRVRMTLGYAGTHYAGWARQGARQTRGKPTVQATVETALAQALSDEVRVTAAGRTDAGVHAEGQVVSFETTAALPSAALPTVLPRYLPADVWALDAADVAPSFDARRSARRRWYRYSIWREKVCPSAWQGRCLNYSDALNVQAMREATRALIGRRQFGSFVAGWGRDGRDARSTTRTVFAADLIACGSLLTFEVCADSFLRQMVRSIVGSLLWVGEGRWVPLDMQRAIGMEKRGCAGPAAAGCGLTLMRVDY